MTEILIAVLREVGVEIDMRMLIQHDSVKISCSRVILDQCVELQRVLRNLVLLLSVDVAKALLLVYNDVQILL